MASCIEEVDSPFKGGVSMASLRDALVNLMHSAGTTLSPADADRLVRALTTPLDNDDGDDDDEASGDTSSLSFPPLEVSPAHASPAKVSTSTGGGEDEDRDDVQEMEESYHGYGLGGRPEFLVSGCEGLGDRWLSR